ncbi:hypothetical protein [Puniceicoccus vermicola]|uniref:Uncharacterized protein n=1 Tax=Puniceicoccus vermicola TaxID=388746 RepID=A0A7X1B129_9BACT|nr:hypothetical protein [Puniceicoccus vermicola]MBC2603670.1 hypothetical protein [Puniceicoccus vermicola]
MAETPQEAAFEQYKEIEKQALRIASELMENSAKLVDVEVALIAAIFVAHRKRNPNMPAEQVAKIIQGHAHQLIPFFQNDSN